MDLVRFLIGDTDSEDPFFQDAEINGLITLEGDPRKAAAKGAETLAAKFARQVDETVGRVKQNCSQAYDHYKDLAKSLRLDAAARVPVPYAGGISISDKDTVRDNEDRVASTFTRSLHDSRQGREDPEESTCRDNFGQS